MLQWLEYRINASALAILSVSARETTRPGLGKMYSFFGYIPVFIRAAYITNFFLITQLSIIIVSRYVESACPA